MYVCMCTCMYVYQNLEWEWSALINSWKTHLSSVQRRLYMHVCTCTCMYTHTRIRTPTTKTLRPTYAPLCIYTSLHTYTHTHTCADTHSLPRPAYAPLQPFDHDPARNLRLPLGFPRIVTPRDERRNNCAHAQPPHAHVCPAAETPFLGQAGHPCAECTREVSVGMVCVYIYISVFVYVNMFENLYMCVCVWTCVCVCVALLNMSSMRGMHVRDVCWYVDIYLNTYYMWMHWYTHIHTCIHVHRAKRQEPAYAAAAKLHTRIQYIHM